MLPASVGFMVLAHPIISTIFQRGKFDVYSTNITANILFFYSIGLFAYGAKRILQSCFFALKDTVTPTKVAAFSLVMNIILNSVLIFPMKMGGIALATSLSGIISFFVLFFLLKKRIEPFGTEKIGFSFLRILLASIGMGVVCYFFRALNLFLVILMGAVSYVIFCFLFRVEEIHQLRDWIRMRKI